MKASHKRFLVWAVIVIFIGIALMAAFAPRPIMVDLFTVERGPMVVTVDEEGETRVHDVFTLSVPVAGRVQRIEAHVGDPVVADETVLAQIEPGDPTLLDPRSEAQAKAAVQAAESALALAAATVPRARAEFDFARTEVARARNLVARGGISRQKFDEAERLYKTSKAALATARAARQMRKFELEQARAQLLSPTQSRAREGKCDCVPITAPVDGRVLHITDPSERVVVPGQPLMQIGDPADLEIVVDFLSADALKVEPGQDVIIDNWGGDEPLAGRVRRVEPIGFTKVSSLGIEEQRVNVVIDFTSEPEKRQRLGHGYQVEARVVLWKAEDVLSVPLTAIFRQGEQWALFVEDDGRAILRVVEIGHRNGLVAEIRSGLQEGDRVVMHPSDRVVDDVRIAGRD
jgi:HlyD family secretion protein